VIESLHKHFAAGANGEIVHDYDPEK